MEVDDAEHEPTIQEDERDKTTADFVSGLKERESLKKELEERTRELNKVKGQNYDLLKKIDEFEKQVAELKAESKTQGKRPKSGPMSKKRVVKRKVPRKSKTKDTLSPDTASTGGDVFEDTEQLYTAIAEKYPELPLSTILIAEKKFVEADKDRSGTIDEKELEQILDSSHLLFTKQQVADILSSIDTDKTMSIDFFECLKVLDSIRANKRTGLPDQLKNNKTAVCIVQ